MDISLGQVVRSKAGRDAGKVFIVTGILDDLHVFISDGNLRRTEKPKKKKVKHLEATREKSAALSQKLESKLKITNAEVRKALADVETGGNAIKEEKA